MGTAGGRPTVQKGTAGDRPTEYLYVLQVVGLQIGTAGDRPT